MLHKSRLSFYLYVLALYGLFSIRILNLGFASKVDCHLGLFSKQKPGAFNLILFVPGKPTVFPNIFEQEVSLTIVSFLYRIIELMQLDIWM